MTIAIAAVLALAVAGSATQPDFRFDRYPPTSLQEAEKPADGICNAGVRPLYTTDSALTPMRLKAQVTHEFRRLAADARRIIVQFAESAPSYQLPLYEEEVLVRVEGKPRWLAIQASVAPFWRDELADGQEVWLYAVRVGCVQPIDPADDRAILSINEFQIEPIGQPEPNP